MAGLTASQRKEKLYKAQTAAEKKKWPRCGHIVESSGKPCQLTSGAGTQHFGKGKCYRHHGTLDMSPMKQIQADTFSMAKPLRTSPAEAMGFVLDLTFGQMVYAYYKVSQLDEDEYWVKPKGGGTEYLNKHIRHLTSLKEETVKYAKAAGDLGIAERLTALAEGQADLIAKYVMAVMGSLKLTPEQEELLGPAIRQQMPMLLAGSGQPDIMDVLNPQPAATVVE